jgi:MtN3 and saliva related transmembrane protein
MKLTIIDNNVSTTMNVFLIIANVINLVYNVPQILKTYQTKSTKDFSGIFIFLRIVGNVIWIPYSIEIDSLLLLINTLVTVLSSIFIGYYKIKEILRERVERIHREVSFGSYQSLNNQNDENDSEIIKISI